MPGWEHRQLFSPLPRQEEQMTQDEAVISVTESFIANMTVEHRDPWEFFDWSHNTWGFQQVQALQRRMREVLAQESPPPDRIDQAVRITRAIFGTTRVPYNESAHGLGEAGAEVFRSALRVIV
jgi:hypothetical protein